MAYDQRLESTGGARVTLIIALVLGITYWLLRERDERLMRDPAPFSRKGS